MHVSNVKKRNAKNEEKIGNKNVMRKIIELGFGGGTIDLMEWIRANNYPALDVAYCRVESGYYTLIVSSYEPTEFDLSIPDEEWFEWKGMKRYTCSLPLRIWIMNIDGHWYYATPY